MIDNVISQTSSEFEKVISHFKNELSRLQIGRASAALVENVAVDVYGSSQPLKAVANISVPESRSLMIQPWDKGNLGAIEKAIADAGLGLNPINDGVVIRINIPPLTEERRRDLTKHVKQLAEQAKIGIRNLRQDANNKFKQMKSSGEITEDDLKNAEKKLQDKVDEANKKIDETADSKESDIMTV